MKSPQPQHIRDILLSLGDIIASSLPPGYKFVLLAGTLEDKELVVDALGDTTPQQALDLFRVMSDQIVKENPQLAITTTTNETL